MYRAAIIGTGSFANMHAQSYEYTKNGKLVACCNRSGGKKLEDFATKYNINGYASAEEMIASEKPDIVHIVTPPQMRYDLMKLVDDMGVPACVVEKPIACGARDYKKILALSKTANTKFAIGKQFRFHPYMQKCRDAVESGRLGNVEFIDCSSGMNIAGQGTHIIDWAMSLNGDAKVVRVFGIASGWDDDDMQHPAPRTTTAKLEFDNGVTALWNTGYTSTRIADYPEVYNHCRVKAYCQTGSTLYEEFGKTEIIDGSDVETIEYCSIALQENNHKAQAYLFDTLYDWSTGGAPSETRLSRALHQWNIVLGVYQSTMSGKPIDIPFVPDDDLVDRAIKHLKKQEK